MVWNHCEINGDYDSMAVKEKFSVGFLTLGCKVNQYETESLKAMFERSGFRITAGGELADAYVINTCTVTNIADRKSRQFIRKAKRANPKAIIAVTGCYAQMSPQDVEQIEGVSIIVGTNEKHRIVGIVKRLVEDSLREEVNFKNNAKSDAEKMIFVRDRNQLIEYEDLGAVMDVENRQRAFVKIQEGCNRFCSYCIIPYARGDVRSRSIDSIREEVDNLVSAGHSEIVLTGINTALYGYDLKNGGVEPLIGELENIEGDFRIRLSSLEPTVINAEYVKKLIEHKKLCNHLHLSIQSGSNTVLKRMNRKYSTEEYMRIVKVLKDFDENFGISTDIIVGFPGETEREFEETLDIVKEVGFCKVHGFRYSPRKGTVAADFTGQVTDKEKSDRMDKLLECADISTNNFVERCKGSTREVLIERREDALYVSGYADNYVRVYVKADSDKKNELNPIGKIVSVKLLNRFKDGMKGVIQYG